MPVRKKLNHLDQLESLVLTRAAGQDMPCKPPPPHRPPQFGAEFMRIFGEVKSFVNF